MKSPHGFTVNDVNVRAQIRVLVNLDFEDGSYQDPKANFELEFPTLSIALIKKVVDLKQLPTIAIEGAMEQLKKVVAEHNAWVLSIQDNGAQQAAQEAQRILNRQDYSTYPEDKTEPIGETGWALHLFRDAEKTRCADLVSLDADNPVSIPLKPY